MHILGFKYRTVFEALDLFFLNCVLSHGRVVTRWPGSQKVWGSIPAATIFVRCKNLAFNIGEFVSRGSDTT